MKLPLFPRTQITHPPEYKGKPKLYPIVYPPQPLMKASFKQLKQMFPNTNEHDHVLKWAADNIKHNDLQALYLRHYKQNPQVHTEENKNKLGHINGMMGISSEMKNVKIDKNDTLESAFKKYDDAEHTWRQGNGARYIEPEGKPVVDFGDGWAWFDLGRPTCGKEGAAMGHCGNSGDPHNDDRILSLRKIVKVGDKNFHEPALTFINNHGWLGEMKGRANSKPAESYHKRIVELLKHPDIKGMVGAGYMPENNFHFDDLSPEHKNQVRMSNPNLVDLRSDDWDNKQKIFASDSVPKIEKYQDTVKDIFQGKRLKEGLDSGKINIDDLEANDLRLLTNHRLFQKQHLLRLIETNSNLSGRPKVQALMAAKNSKHLDDDVINHWVNYQSGSAAQLLGNKLNANHIQTIAEKDPWPVVQYLKNHHLFNQNHIDTIVQKEPWIAKHLKDHPLFNQSHIDTIVQNDPYAAAQYLHDHSLLNASHIQTIAEKNPEAAAQLLGNKLNADHIDTIVQKNPEAAAQYLGNHPLLNANHIHAILQKNPEAAAKYLHDHSLLNASHIQTIAEKNPKAAAQYLSNHRLLNANHIQTIADKNPKVAAQYFEYHPLFNQIFNQKHIDTVVQNDPRAAAVFLNNHPLLNANHIQTIVKYNPSIALQYLNHYPLLYKLFNQKDIDNIVQYEPFLATGLLYNHPLINEKHIDYLVNKNPEGVAHFFKDNPIYQAKYGNKVQKSLQKTQQLEKVLVSSEPSEGVLKIAKYDGMRPNETHVSTTRVPHERFGSVYVHHFESDDGTNARHLVSMHHDPHQAGVSILLAARQNENEPMTVYAAATHPNFQGNRLNYVALREAVKSHGTLHSDVMQSMPAFKNWNRLKQEAGFKVNITKPYREPSAEDASMLPHIAQYSKQAVRKEGLEKVYIHPHNAIAAAHLGVGRNEDLNKLNYIGSKNINGHVVHIHADNEGDEHTFTVHLMPNDKNSQIIGTLHTSPNIEKDKYGDDILGTQVTHTFVLPEHQNKGIGSALHQTALKHHKDLYSAVALSPESDNMWRKLKKLKGAKVKIARHSDKEYSPQHHAIYEEPKTNMEKAVSPEQQKENIKKQRQLKNKEIIAKLKSKVVDKAPTQEPSVQPRLLMSEDDSPAGIPIYLKTHLSHDNLTGVHVHIDKLPSLENYGILDEPRIDRALDSAESKGHSAIYVSTDEPHEPKKPKLQLVKSKLVKALLTKPPQVEHGQYTQPFSMGGTKQEKKTIYSHFDHPEHAKFNAQEHIDAYWRHQEKIKQNPKMESSLVNFHKKQAQMHWDKSRELVDKGDTSRRIEESKPG